MRARGHWARRPFPVVAEHDAVVTEAGEEDGWLHAWVSADRELGRRVTVADVLDPVEAALRKADLSAAAA